MLILLTLFPPIMLPQNDWLNVALITKLQIIQQAACSLKPAGTLIKKEKGRMAFRPFNRF